MRKPRPMDGSFDSQTSGDVVDETITDGWVMICSGITPTNVCVCACVCVCIHIYIYIVRVNIGNLALNQQRQDARPRK